MFRIADHGIVAVAALFLWAMTDRVRKRFDLWPERLIADLAYGSGEMLSEGDAAAGLAIAA